MIRLVAVNEGVPIEIREKFSIIPKRISKSLEALSNELEEVVILSTCNRTEIYFNTELSHEEVICKLFTLLQWDMKLKEFIYFLEDKQAVNHLMQVSCGFHSYILGEDQILSQVRTAYEEAQKNESVNGELQKLFHLAITCGKEFRTKSKLNRIPVSSSSIVVNKAFSEETKSFMILGFGAVAQLTLKYILEKDFNKVYIAARDISKVQINHDKVKVIQFNDRGKYYEDVDCIISCTSAPHCVIRKEDLPPKKFLIFDLAVPRDVDKGVYTLQNVEVFHIDDISKIDDINKKHRRDIMNKNKYIIEKYIKEYENWCVVRELSSEIVNLKNCGEKIYKKRYATFKNKRSTKNEEELAEVLLKSTSYAYINKAIEVLKEEHINGRGCECLDIIKKIFYSAE